MRSSLLILIALRADAHVNHHVREGDLGELGQHFLCRQPGRLGNYHLDLRDATLVSVRRVLESYESSVIQGWWPDSRRGHRCGRVRTAPVTTAASCDIQAT